MSYYAPNSAPRIRPARTSGPSIPSPVGDVGQPRGFVDPKEQMLIQAAFGHALNYRNPDGGYRAKTLAEVRELQPKLDLIRRTH